MWACGVVLYILLTGCCPFQRTSDNRLSRKDRLRVLFSVRAADPSLAGQQE